MLKAFWEDNDALSDEVKVFLRQRDAADAGVRACMLIDYPVGHRVKVETTHKGDPIAIFGLVVSHRVQMGVVEVDVENERTGHLRKFNILTAKIKLEAAPIKADPSQVAIDAFMASEEDSDTVENAQGESIKD